MELNDLAWRKASRSSTNGGNCVELAAFSGRVVARDSKDPAGGLLMFAAAEMKRFLGDVRSGRHDLAR